MFLGLCWLLVAVAYQAEGRVDNDFSQCSQHFYNNNMPVGFQDIAKPPDLKEIPDEKPKENDLVYICQTLGGNSYYATLYDRGRRIPLYSAYILDRNTTKKNPECKRPREFMIEPQLITFQNDMQNENELIKPSQAVKEDYSIKNDPNRTTTTTYDRGHLNPCGHHMEKENYVSTFTLTNVVPQVKELNGGVWSLYEQEMVTISADCNITYVVTGSVPGNNKLNDRVTIPSYVWNAYCCVDDWGEPIKSFGAIAANDKALTTDNKFKVEKMELRALQDILKKHLGVSNDIEIFNENCKVK